jgi:hypothetical protein
LGQLGWWAERLFRAKMSEKGKWAAKKNFKFIQRLGIQILSNQI